MSNPSPLVLWFSSLLHLIQWIMNKLQITSLAQRILLHVLAAGPIPQHIAFVMDGNRRYARGKGKQVHEGHGEGYVALRRVSSLYCSIREGNAEDCVLGTRNMSSFGHQLCICLRIRYR